MILQSAQQIADMLNIAPEEVPRLRKEWARKRLAQMEQYNGFVTDGKLLRTANEEERKIITTARLFNESELNIPAGFVDSVKAKIDFWQTTGRNKYINGIKRANEERYTDMIVHTLIDHGLPAEFFYLALQESDFHYRAVGPATRWGRAKGMWQFIPSTGIAYGLQPGPFQNDNRYDPQDDRHDPVKSTKFSSSLFK